MAGSPWPGSTWPDGSTSVSIPLTRSVTQSTTTGLSRICGASGSQALTLWCSTHFFQPSLQTTARRWFLPKNLGKYSSSLTNPIKNTRTGELIWIQHLSQSCELKCSWQTFFWCAPSWESNISRWIFLLSCISRCKKFWRWRLSSIPHRPGDRPLYYPRPTQHYTMCVGHTLQCWPRHAMWRLKHQKWSRSPCDHWDVKVSIKELLRQGNDTFKGSLSEIQLVNDVFKFRGVACLNVSTLLFIFCNTRFCAVQQAADQGLSGQDTFQAGTFGCLSKSRFVPLALISNWIVQFNFHTLKWHTYKETQLQKLVSNRGQNWRFLKSDHF